MLEIKNLDLTYGPNKILSNVSFQIPKGSILGVLGPNGAGKSSIIKVLAALVSPDKGEIILNGEALKFEDLRLYCGYLIDQPSYYPYLSASENLKLLKRITQSEVSVQELLDLVGLGYTGSKKVKQFSTGMKQRLAIAGALIRSPEILILDEPFNGLDPNGYKDIIQLLVELNTKGTTVMVSSHLLDELEQFATQFLLINHGKVELEISKEDLIKSERRVSFTFENDLPDSVIAGLDGYLILRREPKSLEIKLKPGEIAQLVNYLVSNNAIPINIETHNQLQDTYFQLAQ